MESSAYTIKIDAFEGPFDLLFHLIEKNKVDIYDIPISIVADQYLDYVAAMKEMDLEIASGFLVMASTLLHIKSRLLLPVHKEEDREGADDPRDALVISIIEYKKYKEFSASLRENASYWGEARYRLAGVYEQDGVAGKPEQLSLYDMDRGRLFSVYRDILEDNRRRHENVVPKVRKILEREQATLAKKVREIILYLTAKPRFLFQKIYNPAFTPKLDIIAGFTAVLELSRQGKLTLRQKKQFGGLLVSRKQ
jgi:segregation and condensation protein A